MNSRTLSDLKDSSESLVEINEKNKNNIKTAQVSLNYHTSQANNAAQAYSMAQMKYNQAVSARNAVANRPRQEGEDPENISREMGMYNRLVADAEREQKEARNKYTVALQHQKKAAADYQKAQSDLQDSQSRLTSIKGELGTKISDYTNSYSDASTLVMLGKGENIQPFMQKLIGKKKEAISTLNRVLRSLGEQEVSFDGTEMPGASGTDSPKVKKLVKYPVGRRRGLVNSEARGAYSLHNEEGNNLHVNSNGNGSSQKYLGNNMKYASLTMSNGLAENADYGNLDERTVKDMYISIAETLTVFPELKMQFVGSSQARNEHIEADLRKMYLDAFKRHNPGIDESLLLSEVNKLVLADMNNLYISNNTFAQSLYVPYSTTNTEDIISKYNGITVSEVFGNNYDYFTLKKQEDVQAGWKPHGCDTPKATIDHELGHQIAKLVDAHNDPEIIKAYNKFMSVDSKYHSEILSGYATTNIHEFIAESWSEYRNNPNCRDCASFVSKRILDLYNSDDSVKKKVLRRSY